MTSNVSLVRRLGAVVYDIFIAFSVAFFAGLAANALFENMGDAFFYLITLPSVYLYFIVSWVKGRQTIGMKAWKFQVIQHNQKNITYQQAFIRASFGLISFIFFGLGFLTQLFNKDKLSWHDKLSNTLLVKN